jgi:hypothetical protein
MGTTPFQRAINKIYIILIILTLVLYYFHSLGSYWFFNGTMYGRFYIKILDTE